MKIPDGFVATDDGTLLPYVFDPDMPPGMVRAYPPCDVEHCDEPGVHHEVTECPVHGRQEGYLCDHHHALLDELKEHPEP